MCKSSYLIKKYNLHQSKQFTLNLKMLLPHRIFKKLSQMFADSQMIALKFNFIP